MAKSFDELFNEVKAELNTKYDKTGGRVSGDISAVNARFSGTVSAPHVRGAYWRSDLAELFPCKINEELLAGTAIGLDLNSKEEMYTIASKKNGPVIGVKSEIYGFLLGGSETEDPKRTHVAVALAGVVPMLVLGPIKAGDKIGLSDIAGVGIKVEDDSWYGTALTTNNEPGVYTVKAKVR